MMKIFMSWSGVRSKAAAERLRDWLPDVINNISTWVSSTDIDAGARWNHDVQRELGETGFGVLCLTKSNMVAPWLLFEAGALAKGVEKTHVCPYLIDLQPADIPPGPLTQFQAKGANLDGTWELVQTINASLGDAGVEEDRLRRRFDAQWASLEKSLAKLSVEAEVGPPGRRSEEKLDEILEIVRAAARQEQTTGPKLEALLRELRSKLAMPLSNFGDPNRPHLRLVEKGLLRCGNCEQISNLAEIVSAKRVDGVEVLQCPKCGEWRTTIQ